MRAGLLSAAVAQRAARGRNDHATNLLNAQKKPPVTQPIHRSVWVSCRSRKSDKSWLRLTLDHFPIPAYTLSERLWVRVWGRP
jgi:hypothetical protein